MFIRLLPALTISLLISPASADILYVDANLATGANDGSTWGDAFQGTDGLQAALAVSVVGDQVFVAQGTYRPSASGDRSESFRFQTGIQIYGSFAGGETSPSDRPPFGSAPSILDGDLNGDDGSGQLDDNSYHVLRGAGSDLTGLLDGFTIRGGNANGAGQDGFGGGFYSTNQRQSLRNCRFVDNHSTLNGGAVYVLTAGPRFYDCVFEGNSAGTTGGAAYFDSAQAPVLDRCVFTENIAQFGGAIEIKSSEQDADITNSTFYRNTATGNGGAGAIADSFNSGTSLVNCTIVDNEATAASSGGVRGFFGVVQLRNCIVWGNSGDNVQSGTVAYSLIEGGYPGTGNLSTSPQFLDAASGDFRLSLASPAIDAGQNSAVPAYANLDLAKDPRFADEPDVADSGVGTAPIVDIGAFESAIDVTSSFCLAAPNSAGPGAVMGSSGSTSISGNGFSLSTNGVVPAAFGLYFYGPNQIQVPFGDGIRCVGAGGIGTFRLYPLVQADGAGTTARAVDFGAHPANAGLGAITPGSTWHFQLWFRDGAAGASGFNTSDGLSVTFAP